MSQQLRRILKMVEHGTITAAEGERLFKAMDKSQKSLMSATGERFLHIEINKSGNWGKVNVPLKAAQTFLKTWQYEHYALVEFSEKLGISANDLLRFIEANYTGEITAVEGEDVKARVWIDHMKS